MDLTGQQWALLEPLFEAKRDVLNGALWVLRTGAPWKDLPDRYPPYQTCHRRFQQWERRGVFRAVLECLAEDLRQLRIATHPQSRIAQLTPRAWAATFRSRVAA
jgi:transposase